MEGIVELMVGGLGWTVVVGEIRGFGCFRVLHLVLLMMILSCMVLFRPTAASPYVCTDNFTSSTSALFHHSYSCTFSHRYPVMFSPFGVIFQCWKTQSMFGLWMLALLC
jgi:hypothetical protein